MNCPARTSASKPFSRFARRVDRVMIQDAAIVTMARAVALAYTHALSSQWLSMLPSMSPTAAVIPIAGPRSRASRLRRTKAPVSRLMRVYLPKIRREQSVREEDPPACAARTCDGRVALSAT